MSTTTHYNLERDCNVPAKLIIGDQEIDVILKSIGNEIDETMYDFPRYFADNGEEFIGRGVEKNITTFVCETEEFNYYKCKE